MTALLTLPRIERLLPDKRFSVDSTLVKASASMKIFRHKDGRDGPPSPTDAGGGGTRHQHHICHFVIDARYTEARSRAIWRSLRRCRTIRNWGVFVDWLQTEPNDLHTPTGQARRRTAKSK